MASTEYKLFCLDISMRLFCFVQNVCRYGCNLYIFIGCTRACVCGCDGDVICVGHDMNRCTGWW